MIAAVPTKRKRHDVFEAALHRVPDYREEGGVVSASIPMPGGAWRVFRAIAEEDKNALFSIVGTYRRCSGLHCPGNLYCLSLVRERDGLRTICSLACVEDRWPRHAAAISLTESPIESMMLCALFADLHTPLTMGRVEIIPQYPLPFGYRADILVRDTETSRQLVVECDGAEFHTATEEQIARDARRDATLTEHEFKVIRFTGSAIHASKRRCAIAASRALFGKQQ